MLLKKVHPRSRTPRVAAPTFMRQLRQSAFYLVFARLNDDSSHVVAALRADDVSRYRCATFGADRQLARLFRIMRSTLTGTRIRVFSFWYGHLLI